MLDIQKKALVLAAASSLIFGLSIPLNKHFLLGIDVPVFLWLRFFFIAVMLLGFLLIKKKFDFKRFDKIQWMYILGVSCLWTVFSLLFFYGLKMTLPSHATFFYIGFPILIILLGILSFKRRASPKEFIFMTVWILGVLLVFFLRSEKTDLWNPPLGDVLGIGSVFALSFAGIFYKKSMIKDEDAPIVLFFRFLFGFILLGMFLIFFGRTQLTDLNGLNVLFALSSAMLMGSSVFLWVYSSGLTETKKIFFTVLLAPIATFALSFLMFKEPVSLIQIVGYLLILASFWLIFRKSPDRLRMFDV